jgi:phosphate-selective porin OprO/OprP
LFTIVKGNPVRRIAVSLLLAGSLGATAAAQTDQPAEPAPAPTAPPLPEDLQRKIEEIDQRSRVADRKLELLDEQAKAAKDTTAVVSASDKGFSITSSDKAYEVRVRALVQGDSRWYFANQQLSLKDTFIISKARPFLEATLGGVADFRLVPDFANTSSPIQDAYGEFRPWGAWLRLRVGKFKSPVSLERLQSDAVVMFVERGFTPSIAPNRDIGVMLNGDVSVLSYALAVLNGVTDGASGNADTNRAKDFAARIFLQPFKGDPYSALSGFGIGVAATTGNQKGTSSAPDLPSYPTVGQQTFFQYLTSSSDPSSTVIASKRRNRINPQLYYYVGPFGLLAEYIAAQHTVAKNGERKKLTNQAWLAEASYVLTGDPNGYDGVSVKEPLNPAKNQWGALQLCVRYNELRVDPETFPTYANPDTSAHLARGFGVNLFWSWSRNLAWLVTFAQTRFEGGASGGANRTTENVLFTRAQVAF